MMDHNTSAYSPKFTRGEKCIFFHLVLVFVASLILLIIFILHLYTVEHSKHTALSTRRTGSNFGFAKKVNFPQLGMVYVDTIKVTVCNSLLLNSKWSLGPANCIVARSHPDMAYLLMFWKILYKDQDSFITNIKRSIAHSHFNRDSFSNNIGLMEHVDDIPLQPYLLNFSALQWNNKEVKYLKIITKYLNGDGEDIFHVNYASLLPLEKCVQSILSIVNLRSYEFCVVPKEKRIPLEYGALVLENTKIIGFYSWGEHMAKNLPFIFINITDFQYWINTMVNIS